MSQIRPRGSKPLHLKLKMPLDPLFEKSVLLEFNDSSIVYMDPYGLAFPGFSKYLNGKKLDDNYDFGSCELQGEVEIELRPKKTEEEIKRSVLPLGYIRHTDMCIHYMTCVRGLYKRNGNPYFAIPCQENSKLAFLSPKNQFLVVAMKGGIISIFDFVRKKERCGYIIKKDQSKNEEITSAVICKENKHLFVGLKSGIVMRVEIASKTGLEISPNSDNTWLNDKNEASVLALTGASVLALTISEDNKLLASSSQNGSITVVDLETKEVRAQYNTQEKWTELVITKEQTIIALKTSKESSKLIWYSLEKGEGSLEEERIYFSADKQHIITYDEKKKHSKVLRTVDFQEVTNDSTTKLYNELAQEGLYNTLYADSWDSNDSEWKFRDELPRETQERMSSGLYAVSSDLATLFFRQTSDKDSYLVTNVDSKNCFITHPTFELSAQCTKQQVQAFLSEDSKHVIGLSNHSVKVYKLCADDIEPLQPNGRAYPKSASDQIDPNYNTEQLIDSSCIAVSDDGRLVAWKFSKEDRIQVVKWEESKMIWDSREGVNDLKDGKGALQAFEAKFSTSFSHPIEWNEKKHWSRSFKPDSLFWKVKEIKEDEAFMKQIEDFAGMYEIAAAERGTKCFYETSHNNKYVVLTMSLDESSLKSRVVLLHKDIKYPVSFDLDQPLSDAAILFSPKDNYVIIQFHDNVVKIFDLHKKKEVYSWKNTTQYKLTHLLVPKSENYVLGLFDDGHIESLYSLKETEQSSENGPVLRYIHTKYETYATIHRMTVLHVKALFLEGFLDLEKYDPESRVPHLVDDFNRTPLHYLLAAPRAESHQIKVLVEYMLDYLEDPQTPREEVIEVVNSLSNIFVDVIPKLPSSVAVRFVKFFTFPGYLSGSSKETRMLPGLSGIRYFSDSSPIFRKFWQWYLGKDIYRINMRKFMNESMLEYSLKTLGLQIDYHPASDDAFNTTLALSKINNEDLFKSSTLTLFTHHIWSATYSFNMSLAAWFTTLMILVSVYISEGTRNLGLEISIIVLASIGLVIEAIQALTIRSRYLLDVWNFVDLAGLVLIITFMAENINNSDDQLTRNWVSTFVILMGYIRWISYLRLFSMTRNLIEIIISILKDMRGFVIIMLLITVGFALIFLQFQRENQEAFITQLYNTYQIWYGSTDKLDDGTASIQVLLSAVLFILPVVLLNMLIAIMGDSYDKVQSKRLLTDCKTKMDMSLEAIAVWRMFSRRKRELRYLHFLVPIDQDVDGEGVREEEWDGKINEIRKQINQIKATIKDEVGSIKSQISSQVKSIRDEMEKISQGSDPDKIKSMIKDEIDGVKTQLEKISQGSDPDQIKSTIREEVNEIKVELLNEVRKLLK